MAFLFTALVFMTNMTVGIMSVLQGDMNTAMLTLLGALISGAGLCTCDPQRMVE